MLKIELVAPHERIFSGEADIISVPGSKSPFQVLVNHAPIVSSLEQGIIQVKTNNGDTYSFVSSAGFIEVLNNKVSILVDFAINVKDLDESVIRDEIKDIQNKISNCNDKEQIESLKSHLKLATIKLKSLEKW